MYERNIIHLNIADFAVAVERVIDSRYRERPVVIAPEGAVRASVYDMSEEAYRSGIRKGMALRRAMRLCRDIAILPPRPARYEQAMRALVRRALPYSPQIEMADGDGHLFVDISGTSRLFGPPPDVAWRLRKEIRKDLSLDPIWSVAPNKLVAKVATRIVKPTGEFIVESGDEEAFLTPLAVHMIPGIERPELLRLREFNLTAVRQVRTLSLSQLDVIVGRQARGVYESVRGVDFSPVRAIGEQPPVVVRDHPFGNDTNDAEQLENVLYAMTESAGASLRKRKLATRRIGVILDYSDGGRIVRQAAANPATANDHSLFAAAKCALYRAWTRRIRIRHLRLIADRLVFPPAQLDLFETIADSNPKSERLISTLDRIRSQFGHDAIRVGRTMPFGA